MLTTEVAKAAAVSNAKRNKQLRQLRRATAAKAVCVVKQVAEHSSGVRQLLAQAQDQAEKLTICLMHGCMEYGSQQAPAAATQSTPRAKQNSCDIHTCTVMPLLLFLLELKALTTYLA